MPSHILSVVMVLLSLDSAALAYPPPDKLWPCARSLAELAEDLKRGLFTPREIEKVHSLLASQNLSPDEAASKAFDLVFEARLKDLPPELANDVKSRVEANYRVKRGSGGGLYNSLTGSISVSVPDRYRATLMEFMLKVHEVEHVIQDRQSLALSGNHRLKRWVERFLDLRNQRFFEEMGSMLMEWNYLKAIPSSDRKQMIERLKNDKTINESLKRRYIDALEVSDFSFVTSEDYLKMRWREIPLYSYEGMTRVLRVLQGMGGLQAVLFALVATNRICLSYLKSPDFDSEAAWFRNVCLRLKAPSDAMSAR